MSHLTWYKNLPVRAQIMVAGIDRILREKGHDVGQETLKQLVAVVASCLPLEGHWSEVDLDALPDHMRSTQLQSDGTYALPERNAPADQP